MDVLNLECITYQLIYLLSSSTAAQRFVLVSHSWKLPFVWNLHVFFVFVQISRDCSGFPHHENMHTSKNSCQGP